jgi:ubiquinone biosynthesis protein
VYRLAVGLGGCFVKLGQVLGARADVFPAALLEPLRRLHDRVPARPFAELAPHVAAELGRPLSDVFVSVEDRALAAASLAQVHRAQVGDGEVVLKVQYPEASRLFPIDMTSFRFAVRVIRWLNRGLDLRPLADELARCIELELDFAREARSTERIRVALANGGPERVRVPRVYCELSSARLLVLEYLPGRPISDVAGLAADHHVLPDLVERIAALYCWMIFELGFFHGDPHPGNILVAPDGGIALLDFGLAKELPPGFGSGAARMIACGLSGDAGGAVEAARAIGFSVSRADPRQFAEIVRRMLGGGGGESGLRDLVRETALDEIPPHFALILRVFVLLSGLSHLLAPGEPLVARVVMRSLARHLTVKPAITHSGSQLTAG